MHGRPYVLAVGLEVVGQDFEQLLGQALALPGRPVECPPAPSESSARTWFTAFLAKYGLSSAVTQAAAPAAACPAPPGRPARAAAGRRSSSGCCRPRPAWRRCRAPAIRPCAARRPRPPHPPAAGGRGQRRRRLPRSPPFSSGHGGDRGTGRRMERHPQEVLADGPCQVGRLALVAEQELAGPLDSFRPSPEESIPRQPAGKAGWSAGHCGGTRAAPGRRRSRPPRAACRSAAQTRRGPSGRRNPPRPGEYPPGGHACRSRGCRGTRALQGRRHVAGQVGPGAPAEGRVRSRRRSRRRVSRFHSASRAASTRAATSAGEAAVAAAAEPARNRTPRKKHMNQPPFGHKSRTGRGPAIRDYPTASIWDGDRSGRSRLGTARKQPGVHDEAQAVPKKGAGHGHGHRGPLGRRGRSGAQDPAIVLTARPACQAPTSDPQPEGSPSCPRATPPWDGYSLPSTFRNRFSKAQTRSALTRHRPRRQQPLRLLDPGSERLGEGHRGGTRWRHSRNQPPPQHLAQPGQPFSVTADTRTASPAYRQIPHGRQVHLVHHQAHRAHVRPRPRPAPRRRRAPTGTGPRRPPPWRGHSRIPFFFQVPRPQSTVPPCPPVPPASRRWPGTSSPRRPSFPAWGATTLRWNPARALTRLLLPTFSAPATTTRHGCVRCRPSAPVRASSSGPGRGGFQGLTRGLLRGPGWHRGRRHTGSPPADRGGWRPCASSAPRPARDCGQRRQRIGDWSGTGTPARCRACSPWATSRSRRKVHHLAAAVAVDHLDQGKRLGSLDGERPPHQPTSLAHSDQPEAARNRLGRQFPPFAGGIRHAPPPRTGRAVPGRRRGGGLARRLQAGDTGIESVTAGPRHWPRCPRGSCSARGRPRGRSATPAARGEGVQQQGGVAAGQEHASVRWC